jgi:hypothetical protein
MHITYIETHRHRKLGKKPVSREIASFFFLNIYFTIFIFLRNFILVDDTSNIANQQQILNCWKEKVVVVYHDEYNLFVSNMNTYNEKLLDDDDGFFLLLLLFLYKLSINVCNE